MPFFRQELAIDLGTANTVIFKDDKVVLDEPSIIAVETKTEMLVAIGHQAQLIEDHTPPHLPGAERHRALSFPDEIKYYKYEI